MRLAPRGREHPDLVVLQRVQPLTTDVRGMTSGAVVVVTDGSASAVSRADAPPPPEVVEVPVHDWESVLGRWAADGPVDVVTNDEFALRDLARVRAVLGLDPVTPIALDAYVDKTVMKAALQAAGIAVPRWQLLPRVTDGLGLPCGLELPCVVKPRVGANSRGVRVIRSAGEWRSWVAGHTGEDGWQVEQHVDGRMCFVDGVVADGRYRPVLVGQYLGPLLPTAGVHVLGAVDVPDADPLYDRAVTLGRIVAQALGLEGRFATHLEFFDTDDGPVVMEVCARAPGAMVSEMARVVAGHNLETAHLRVQAGRPAPAFRVTGRHAAWISLLSLPGQPFVGPPGMASSLALHRLPAPPGQTGRYVSALGLLTHDDHGALTRDLARCAEHAWYAPS